MADSEQAHAKNRINILLVGFFICLLTLVLRSAYLQILKHSEYSRQATEEHNRKYEIPAKRGEIYCLDGISGQTKTPLTLNQSYKLLYADPSLILNKSETASRLTGITGESAQKYLELLMAPGTYVVLNSKISLDMANKISKLNLIGIGLTDKNYRAYPEGNLASQVLGFVNSDDKGQYGVEGYMDKELSGTNGLLSAKTDTRGIPIVTADNIAKDPIDGTSLVLTIDRNIQAQVEKYLAEGVKAVSAKSGSVVIMDPNTGAIKAIANFPTYDPANYSVIKDYSVFSNSVISNLFEPGSSFKVFTMAAGLDLGKVKPATTYNDPGVLQIDGYTIRNAEGKRWGVQTMIDVIQKSLNTGAIFVLKSLGGDLTNINITGKQYLYDYLINHFGFGSKTGIEQTGEASGVVNKPSSSNVNYANMTFGQGVSATMIQMVTAVSAIANKGTIYKPYLIDQKILADNSIVKTDSKVVRTNIISTQTATDLTNMMIQVVEHGSGWMTKIKGYKIAGKTGTAQVPKSNSPGYEAAKNIGSFIGFAPAEKPKFIMMVRLDEPKTNGFAESTTVPIFAHIAEWLLKYYEIPPSG